MKRAQTTRLHSTALTIDLENLATRLSTQLYRSSQNPYTAYGSTHHLQSMSLKGNTRTASRSSVSFQHLNGSNLLCVIRKTVSLAQQIITDALLDIKRNRLMEPSLYFYDLKISFEMVGELKALHHVKGFDPTK